MFLRALCCRKVAAAAKDTGEQNWNPRSSHVYTQRDRKLRIGGRKTLEAALLIKIDTISVGSYMKGFPKYTDMLPGAKTVEIRHFQGWKDKSAMAGLLFGIIEASIAESNNLHTHHKLIFPTKPRKHLDFL